MVSVRLVKVVFVGLVKAAESVVVGPMALRTAPGSSMKWIVCTVRCGSALASWF